MFLLRKLCSPYKEEQETPLLSMKTLASDQENSIRQENVYTLMDMMHKRMLAQNLQALQYFNESQEHVSMAHCRAKEHDRIGAAHYLELADLAETNYEEELAQSR